MKRGQTTIICTFLALLVAAPAHSVVYIWKDTAGATHYTNKEYEIPPRYRSRMKILYPEQAEQPSVQPASPVQQAVTPTPTVTPPAGVATQPKIEEPRALPRTERRPQRRSSSED